MINSNWIVSDGVRHSMTCGNCGNIRCFDLISMSLIDETCQKCDKKSSDEAERIRMYKFLHGKVENLFSQDNCRY